MIGFVRLKSPTTPLSSACSVFGKTRDAWYKANSRKEKSDLHKELILNEIYRIRAELPGSGGRKLKYNLKEFLELHGIKFGRKKVFSLLKENDLLIKRKKNRKLTTNSNHPFRKYKNLVKELTPERPNHVWVSDITYVLTGAKPAYLSLLTDAYSRKIVGWSLEKSLWAVGPVTALKQGLKQRKSKALLYHHSDRGVQYCCHEYVGLLKKNDIKISMTQNGDPGENAIAERVNGILKIDFLKYWFHGNFEAALEATTRAIRNYNEIRPHESLNYRTPNEVHNQSNF